MQDNFDDFLVEKESDDDDPSLVFKKIVNFTQARQ